MSVVGGELDVSAQGLVRGNAVIGSRRDRDETQRAKVKPQYSADQEYRDVNESHPIGRAGPGLPGDVLVRVSTEGQNEDSSGTRNSHNMRIRRRGRIAARVHKI